MKNLTVKVYGGEGPYIWSLVNVNNCPCVTFLETTGLATKYENDNFALIDISVNIDKDIDPACATNCNVELVITDKEGCVRTILLSDLDPCVDFSTSPIVQSSESPYLFSIQPMGGSGSYTYEWSMRPSLFFEPYDSSPQSNNFIKFIPKPNVYGATFTMEVTVVVRDTNGCSTRIRQNFGLCRPQLGDVEIQSFCHPKDGEGEDLLFSDIFSVKDIVRICDNASIVKLQFMLPDNDIVVQEGTDKKYNLLYLKRSLFKSGVVIIPFFAIDSDGTSSNIAKLIIHEVQCFETEACEFIVKKECNPRAKYCNQDPIKFDLDDFIISPKCCDSNEVDWSTFNIESGPIAPATAVFDPYTHILTYNRNGGTQQVDYINWSVSDSFGKHSGTVTVIIDLTCYPTADLTDDVYEMCNDELDYEMDVLANDVGPNLVPATLMINTNPSNGSAFVLNGKIYYTPNVNFVGVDSFSYKVANSDGLFSTATVTITVNNAFYAGIGGEVAFCDDEMSITAEVFVSNLYNNGEFDVSFKGFMNNMDELDDGDEYLIQFEVDSTIIASCTVLVGQDWKTVGGIKVGTDNDWLTGATFSQYWQAGVFDKTSLASLSGKILKFNKQAWAIATGNIVTYNIDGTVDTDDSFEVEITVKAKNIATTLESVTNTYNVPKVKIWAFEDTNHTSIADGSVKCNWTWLNAGTDSICTACSGLHPGEDLRTWFSEIGSNPYCKPPQKLIEYKIVGEAIQYPIGIILSSEGDFALELASLHPTWMCIYRPYTSLNATYGIVGNNSSYLSSVFLKESDKDLEYIVIEYDNGTINQGKQAKVEMGQYLLF